jgi:hypothetical protein
MDEAERLARQSAQVRNPQERRSPALYCELRVAVQRGLFPGCGGSVPPRRPKGSSQRGEAPYRFQQARVALAVRRVAAVTKLRQSGAFHTMASNTSPLTEVLHSENHSKLSNEQIAKAVARHNKNHSAAKEENAAAKANKGGKK